MFGVAIHDATKHWLALCRISSHPCSGPMATVFIVDDDSRVVKALGRALRTEGFHVEAPQSARQLLAQVEHDEPSCVLLDMFLPGITGLEIQQELKADMSLPVIFLTGHRSVAASAQAMKQGAFEFLLKPVDMSLLLDTVRRARARSADIMKLQDGEDSHQPGSKAGPALRSGGGRKTQLR
jgi:FixJ family two-component response regulator